MMAAKNEAMFQELELVRSQHDGILRGEDVVEWARDPSTALHDRFEWDDAKCGEEYRLWQARRLIAVFVTVVGKDNSPIRAFVSLRTDRVLPGGGYRTSVDVMTDTELRKQLLAEALDDAQRWQAKYQHLSELIPVFKQLARVRGRTKKQVA